MARFMPLMEDTPAHSHTASSVDLQSPPRVLLSSAVMSEAVRTRELDLYLAGKLEIIATNLRELERALYDDGPGIHSTHDGDARWALALETGSSD